MRAQQNTSSHVLVVDDEPENLRLLGPLLAENGYRVHVAESGEQALSTIASMAGDTLLDLVLLDIFMPGGIDGTETCRRLKAREDMRSVPIVFLTGKDDRDTLLRAFEAGGADYVLRPCESGVLLARVRAHARLGRLSRHLEHELAERTHELTEANRQLQYTNDRLRALANEISLVEAREKQRLAAELHDSPMQKLNLAQMQIRSAAKRRDRASGELLETGLELMREALAELRTLQFEISPPVLYQQGLGAALRWLADSTTRRFGVQLEFCQRSPAPSVESNLSVLLFQCARELVYNLLKHAHASRGWLELDCAADWLILRVTDNGKGYAPGPSEPDDSAPGGHGLFGIRERLRLLGGELRLTPGTPGTVAVISVPRKQAQTVRED